MHLRLLGFTHCAALAALLAGCPSSANGPAREGNPLGPADRGDDPPAEAKLELLSAPSLTLRFGEEATLEVRYSMPDGAPIRDGVVSFALVGSAAGSSLATLDVDSDKDGVAHNTLASGEQASSFQVRVAAAGAQPLLVNVAVSDRGFGALNVSADYVGNRFVARRTVLAQAAISCEEATRRPGDPMLTLTEYGPARFAVLPAERLYAVSVFAEGSDALTVARGCVDGVLVRADRDTDVTVVFTDEPLSIDGRFHTQLTLDSSAPAAVLAQTIRTAGTTMVQSDVNGLPAPLNAQGRYLLDVLDRTLRSEQYTAEPDYLALADLLADERATPTLAPGLEEQLEARLAQAGLGALVALETLVTTSEASVATTTLDSVLVLARDDGTLEASWEPSVLRALPIGTALTAPAQDLSPAGSVAMQANLVLALDRVEVQYTSVALGWGALGAQSLGVAVGVDSGLQPALCEALGTGELGAVLDGVVWAAGGCDAGCLEAVCARGLGTLVAGAESALVALDSARPLTVLGGELLLTDKDGDLSAESLSGRMEGQWQSDAEPGEALSGTSSGRIEALVTPSPPGAR